MTSADTGALDKVTKCRENLEHYLLVSNYMGPCVCSTISKYICEALKHDIRDVIKNYNWLKRPYFVI